MPMCEEAVFQYAYTGLLLVSEHLDSRIVHYRTRSGHLLTTLDEVQRALETGDLAGSDALPYDFFLEMGPKCLFPWCGVDGKKCVDCAQKSS